MNSNRLKEFLDYNIDTGIFKWKIKPAKKVNIGAVAGHVAKDGYIRIRIDKKIYLAHRLAWLYMYGYFPENFIDHIDRNPSNNRISNLREITNSCNIRNTGQRKNNTSGIKGVYWNKRDNKWQAQIMINKRGINLGSFADFNDAVKARWEAEKLYKYPNCCSDSIAYQYLLENNLMTEKYR